MASKYLQSILYFLGFTGLGYTLYAVTTPNQEDIKRNRYNLPGSEKNPREVISKNQKFLDVLQAASNTSKPIYRLTKEEIEKEIIKKN